MLDFTGVKSITIPEGSVKKITRKSDSVVLWKKGFTNQIPISTNEDGSLCVGANGEKGYLLDKRCSLSGGGVKDASGYSVTGLIPIKHGDTLRAKNINMNDQIIMYDSARKMYGRMSPHIIFSPGVPFPNGVVYTAVFSANYGGYSTENCAFIRVNSAEHITEASIVTVNEEIE